MMRGAILFLFLTVLLAGHLSAGTVSFQLVNQGGNVYRYEFFPNGLGLLRNQELDIRFDPSLFGSLFNGVADADFKLVLLQPNNPIGTFGDYSALALVDNPSLAGPFSVDVRWFGTGVPDGLPFIIHQFDSSGQLIIGTISTGTVGVPEPSGWLLSAASFTLVGFLSTVRRRR
jgi:hypothetical protein